MKSTQRRAALAAARLGVFLLCAAPGIARAQGSGVITGVVTDSSSKAPVEDVVVTLSSPSALGEPFAVTDATGLYRVPQLAPGVYTLRLEKTGFRPYAREGIILRLDQTVRLNVELLPEVLQAEEVLVVVGRAPTIDVGSSHTGLQVTQDVAEALPLISPTAKNGASRSIEALAAMAPQVDADRYGVSINGSSSPENLFIVDGLSVNDPAYGVLGTPLTLDFVKEVNVISGGYLPEYGRSMGGILNVVTKSGGNAFHGSVFGSWAPGALSGEGNEVTGAATSIGTTTRPFNIGNFGAEVGGPILQDKLWFYAGFAPSFTRYSLQRNLYVFQPDGGRQALPGTQTRYFADSRTTQYMGKLTWLVAENHTVSLSVYGTPWRSGGAGHLGVDPQSGAPETQLLNGPIEALGHQYVADSLNVAAKLQSSLFDKKLLLDVTLGVHHQDSAVRASDGSAIGSNTGLSTERPVWLSRSDKYALNDLEDLPDPSLCDPKGTVQPTLCPVSEYNLGGPRGPTWPVGNPLSEATLNRYQAKAVATSLLSGLGHHIVKAGFDLELTQYDRLKGFPAGEQLRDFLPDGSVVLSFRQLGYLTGPDEPVVQQTVQGTTRSLLVGGFLQDSWNILDVVTLNVGLRYDAQTLYAADGRAAMVLGNEWSPRVGLVYDFTQQGRSKLYANYARYYESMTLQMVDRSFPGDHFLNSARLGPGLGGTCDLLDRRARENDCQDPAQRVPLSALGSAGTFDPQQKYLAYGQDTTAVDPAIRPPTLDEIVVGGEYEPMADARVGVAYTQRDLLTAIEDLSITHGNSYFFANPGYGMGKDFPKATRRYQAFTVYLSKRFADEWFAQASYTGSSLYGNYAGLFRAENGQLEPNLTSDFDLPEFLGNREGPLPQDRTHSIKLYGAKQVRLGASTQLTVGGAYLGHSGGPISYMGPYAFYGPNEIFLLPRGSAGRLPWVHSLDAHVGVTHRFGDQLTVTAGVDVFNLFNFQQAVAVDEVFTFDQTSPITDGSSDLSGITNQNPNFGRPTAFQAPRQVRFDLKVGF